MAWYEIFLTILFSSGLTAALFAFLFKQFERKIEKRDAEQRKKEEQQEKEQNRKEEARKNHEILLIKSTSAAIALGEATARAVQKIPDAHCNGEMKAALEYATQIKHEQKEFLTQQGVDALFE